MGGFPLSKRVKFEWSFGSGMVIPLLILKNAVLGGNVGETFPTWP
jgi:hypothetical protein